MAPSPSSLSRRVSATKCLLSFTLVRRLGRGLGRPSRLSGRFGPVGHPSGRVVYLRQGTASCQLGLFQFRSPLRGRTVVVFCDDSTAVHSLRKGGAPGLLSSTPWLRRSCARWSPSPSACSPVPSRLRHRPNRLPVSPSPAHTSRVVFTHDRLSVFEKTVAGSTVFFATSATHRGSIYFSPFRDPWSAGTDAFLQIWDSLRAYAFPPVAVIRVLSRSSGHPRGRDSLL